MDRQIVAGRYLLLSIIGSGGMGRVWLADDELLRRKVAIKELTIPADVSSADKLSGQLATVREARAAARLGHPGVVRVFDVIRSADRSWIVMEYIKSRSLQDIILQHGPLPHREAARIGLAVLQALRAAHAAGVVHRDVKPHNVLVADDDGRVVLSDFGLATFEGADSGESGPLMGSPQFVAPERLRTGRSSPQADLWSLGATLYAAMEGRPPFTRATTLDSLNAVITEAPDPMRHPGPLEAVIDNLLVKDPAARMTPEAAEDALHRITVRAVGTFPVLQPGRPDAAAQLPTQRVAQGESRTARPGVPLVTRIAPFTVGIAPVPQPVTPTAAVPEDRRRRRRNRFAIAAALVVLAGTAGVAVGYDATLGQSAAVQPGAQSSGSVTATNVVDGTCDVTGVDATPVTTATGQQPYALPNGWIWHQDDKGFQLAVPKGWSRYTDGSAVCFRDQDGARSFAVDTDAPRTRQPLTYWQQQEASVTLPGYRRVAMGVVLLRNGGADWEYTWAPEAQPRQHVRQVLLSVSAERAYLLQWTTSDQDWQHNEPYQRLIVASFS